MTATDKHTLLKRYWGYDAFKPLQEEIIDSLLAGRDTVALLPTGGGKSLCYQLPALMLEGLCVVVSPLVALMKDQVQRLNERGIKAACIVAGMGSQVVNDVMCNCASGRIKLLYVSPERLQQRSFLTALDQVKVGLIAVDEAHCVSQWGHDFRPPYLRIADFRRQHPQATLVGLTATATEAVLADIVQSLGMRAANVLRGSFMRPNLSYMVLRESNKKARLLRVLGRTAGSAIVYVRYRRSTEALAAFLCSKDIPALAYHAGLAPRERDLRQASWMEGKARVMVATNAFGMGIDKADVRVVAHMDVPDSLEAYFQEAGRAGRDGLPAYAVLLHDDADLAALRANLEASFPPLKFIRGAYRALCNFYQLPIGSGEGSQFGFSIEKICKRYQLPPRQFYSAMLFLQREGIIELPDEVEGCSRVRVALKAADLYRFRVDNPQLGHLLEVLLRMYPGIAADPVKIEERRVATRCYCTASDVAGMLARLNNMRVVQYQPKVTGPQIVFTAPCIDERNLYIREENYGALKQAAVRRLEAMESYIANGDVCRSRQMSAYFGEAAAPECGVCDVCLRHHAPSREAVRQAVLDSLREAPMRIGELCECLERQGVAHAEQAVRDLMDEGLVRMDANLFLSVVG